VPMFGALALERHENPFELPLSYGYCTRGKSFLRSVGSVVVLLK
jgi:hypothetical protein